MASQYKEKLDQLLSLAMSKNASDLHLGVGRLPTLRIDGSLIGVVQEQLLNQEMVEEFVAILTSPEQRESLYRNKQLDFAYSFEDKARFRVNVYYQRGYLAAALRLISAKIKSIDELGLPPILHDFARLSQGLVLVVGPAGHGKSTTLAAILDEINHLRTDHIITIEDPIEYLFTQDHCIISQKEVGIDVLSFGDGLKTMLRQDPDVIMIGEMRDKESIATAMTAAETGHVVFSTLHTNSASQTIDRIIEIFPTDQQGQMISQLAANLVGIVSLRLIPKINGGRVAAFEIMFANAAVRNLIRERKTYQIDLVIETSAQQGMITLNRTLANLVNKKLITLEDAELYSPNPMELKILMERDKRN